MEKRTEISIEKMREIIYYELKQPENDVEHLTAADGLKCILFDLKAYENVEDWRV